MKRNRKHPGFRFGLAAALLLSGVFAEAAGAQGTGQIRGTVRESGTQRPLATIQVVLPASGKGVLTAASGAFHLVGVPAGQIVVRVQGLGYGRVERTVTVAQGATVNLDIELAPSAIALDEVVVTGSGAPTERRKLGNTVATIDARTLDEAPTANVSEVLQGREPGVLALPGGGVAGEGARIRIRGNASLSQSNEPLVYVDGVRVDNAGGFSGGIGGNGGSPSRLDDLNPAAIERIEILKGAAAATLYGTEASKGVIQIFTRRGTAGAPRWTLEVEHGVSAYPEDRYRAHAGFARRESQADSLSAFWGQTIRPWEVFEVELVPRLFETGHRSTSALSVSGGGEQIAYFVAARSTGEDGPFTADGFLSGDASGLERARDVNGRRQANANLTLFPSERLRIGIHSTYVESATEIPNNNNDIYGPTTSVIRSKPEQANANNPTGDPAFTNIREVLHLFTEQDVRRFAGSVSANFRPSDEFTIDATAGADVVGQEDTYFMPFGWNTDGVSRNNITGSRSVSARNHRSTTLDVKGLWDRPISDVLSSVATIGVQGFRTETRVIGGTGARFPGPGLEVAGAGADQTIREERLQEVSGGVFAQEQIGYRDFLFVTAGARLDRHSAFGASTGGALYPKLSVSLVPSDLPGWRSSTLSSLRLRGAVGQSGLQPGAFDKLTTYTPLASESGAGVVPANLGNEALRPEVSTEWEAGSEAGLWQDRVALQLTYWDRTVDDLLVARQFAPSGGFRNPQLDNIGQMKAWGVELGATGLAVKTPAVALELFANAAFLREKITDLGGAPPIKIGYVRYRNWLKEGYAPGAFFGPRLADAANPIDVNRDGTADSDEELLAFLAQPRNPSEIPVLLADEDGDGDLLDHYLGKPTPDWQGAFGGKLSLWSNLHISTLVEYRFGNYYHHNLTGAFQRSSGGVGRNIRESAEVEATLLNPASTPEQRLAAARIWARELASLTPQDGLGEIEPADFLRLREVSVGYAVPARYLEPLGVRSLDLALAGRNLGLLTRYGGVDPELNAIGRGATRDVLTNNFLNGVEAWGFALPRRISLSAKVGF
jgi:TonB-linked SusC/RagA family outer membrane protein